MGRITQDLELKTTASGISVTSFSIAVDRNYVKQGEERQTDFINVVCWRKQAEFVCRYFEKGSMIALEGQLQTRTYQAKDGSNRYVTEVVADSVSFTGEKREQSNNGYQPNVQVAHYISRSRMGLGIAENLVCLCVRCHFEYDNGKEPKSYRNAIQGYLKAHYPDWSEKKLVYRKWGQ